MRRGANRLLAPAAFLLAVTVAVVLVRVALDGDDSGADPARTRPATTQLRTTEPAPTVEPAAPRRFYVIASGDTLGSIALRFRTTVEELLALNPGIEPTALTPGQRLRIP